jgi:cytidine deaminase
MTPEIRQLVEAAREAAKQAHAPYSTYGVGAAVRLSDGQIISGCNFENASYGMTLCAETVALAMVNSAGKLRDVREIAIVGGPIKEGAIQGVDPVHPCGRCRQIINEAAQLSNHDVMVHCAAAEGDAINSLPISALLPHAFGPSDIGVS